MGQRALHAGMAAVLLQQVARSAPVRPTTSVAPAKMRSGRGAARARRSATSRATSPARPALMKTHSA